MIPSASSGWAFTCVCVWHWRLICLPSEDWGVQQCVQCAPCLNDYGVDRKWQTDQIMPTRKRDVLGFFRQIWIVFGPAGGGEGWLPQVHSITGMWALDYTWGICLLLWRYEIWEGLKKYLKFDTVTIKMKNFRVLSTLDYPKINIQFYATFLTKQSTLCAPHTASCLGRAFHGAKRGAWLFLPVQDKNRERQDSKRHNHIVCLYLEQSFDVSLLCQR